jgi:NADH-quinone oxidoreductase subunit C
MRYDPLQQRVVYEPVSIEPRVLVPRVIRDAEQQQAAGMASMKESDNTQEEGNA